MRIDWINKKTGNKIDISDYIADVTWSGSATQASRKLDISVLHSPLDSNIKDININLGDRLKLYEDGKLLINAMVYTRERLNEQGTISYSAYDELNRLLRSNGTYNFKNTTAENITNTVCNELKISKGDIAVTKVPIKKLLIDGDNYYNIILKAYTKAFKANGKKYMPFMYDTKLYVIEKGEIIEGFYLDDSINITASSYNEDIESVVNRIRIYDDKGRQIGEVKNTDSISNFGIFQDVYTKEDGVNSTTAAKNLLHGNNKTASIEALGNIKCVSGYGLKIKDSITKLTGIFWIENDKHVWSNGTYTMELELNFKNIMEVVEGN